MKVFLKRLALAVVAAVFVVLGALPASANDEVIRELVASYDVQADGTVDVTWQVDWDFGEPGRRGVIIGLVMREPWDYDPEMDVVYEVTDLDVVSPTGAPEQFTTSTSTDHGVRFLDVRIGDPDAPLAESRHTYTLSYTISGALRTFDGVPELFWDVANDYPPIEHATVTVDSPGGVTQARCLVDDRECDASVTAGTATYRADGIGAGESLSVVAALHPGQVANAEPVLEEAPETGGPVDPPEAISWLAGADPRVTNGVVGLLVAGLLAIPRLLGGRARDQRYAAVPPGVMDPQGPVTTARQEGSIPVRFEPPDATLVEAGLAMDRAYKSTHLAAVLVQMAVNGALRISTDPLRISQGDPARLGASFENGIWQHANPADAHEAPTRDRQFVQMTESVVRAGPRGGAAVLGTVKRSWLSGRLPMLLLFGMVVLYAYATRTWDARVMVPLMLSVIPGLIIGFWVGNLVASFRRRKTPLTARGSALRDQTEGFRQYLATAEAAQLNFEAGQDIYRRYLPWAVLFDLTERWTEICEDLARMGRVPAPDVTFIGSARDTRDINRAVGRINSSTRSAQRSRQAATRRSYGGGSGGRSGFSSRSRGGGGGGGSRGRSW